MLFGRGCYGMDTLKLITFKLINIILIFYYVHPNAHECIYICVSVCAHVCVLLTTIYTTFILVLYLLQITNIKT